MTAGFRAFVAEHEGPLLRTAYLLTGDPQSAEELLAAALAGTRRRWRRAAADPVAAVRRAMVRGLVPSRDRPAADRAVEFPGDAAPPPPDGDDQELRRAVLDLPPRTRAALVLRLHDALSEAEAAEVLDCSPSTVAALTVEAT